MSLAVSAVVRPSRILLALVSAACLAETTLGLSLVLGLVGASPNPALRSLLGTGCLFLAFLGFYHGIRHRKILHIDISGAGQIRISQVDADSSCALTDRPHVEADACVHRLLDGTTIWPNLLLLRLRRPDGKSISIPIMPDSVSRESFRALSVACRWLARRNDPAATEAGLRGPEN